MHLRWKKTVCMDINESQILIIKYNVQKLALLLKYVLWYASWGGPWWMPQWVREKHVIRQSLCGEFYWKRGMETGERERKRENEKERERSASSEKRQKESRSGHSLSFKGTFYHCTEPRYCLPCMKGWPLCPVPKVWGHVTGW